MKVGGAARLFSASFVCPTVFFLPSPRRKGSEHAPRKRFRGSLVSNQARVLFFCSCLFFVFVGYNGDGLVNSRLNFERERRASGDCSFI